MRPTAKITKWEKVFIFISSTFNDMHAERDYLVKNVFPELSEWCERRKLRMVDIDLRWGVTEADATQNRNVVNVCLNRIDECRPFFLCFLGQRYGWVPERKDVSTETFEKFPGLEETMNRGASVTELEILHSLVSPFHSGHTVENKQYHPAEYSFFYFRDEAYIKDLPKDLPYLRKIYSDLEEEDEQTRNALLKKRKALKKRIEDTHQPCHMYQARWSQDHQTPEIAMPLQCPATIAENQKRWRRDWLKYAGVHVSKLDVEEEPAEAFKAREFNDNLNTGRLIDFRSETLELSDLVIGELKAAIQARFSHHKEREDHDELQREIDQQEQFVFINSEGFIKRTGDFDELDEYVENSSNNVFVLTAGAGMGKSTLLANWVDNYRTAFQDELSHSIHFRFIGASDGSTTVYSLLRLLLKEIKEVSDKLADEIPDDPQKLRRELPDLLETIGKNGKTVIVLDALNQLETSLSDLTWLPRSLPEGIKLIVSFKREEGDAEDLYINFTKDERVNLAEVKPFEDREDRRRLIDAYLSQFLKKLDERHIESLIDSEATRNPLYLKVVLSELRVFGAFANLGEKIRTEFGETPLSAFEAVLQRLEQDPAYSPIDPQKAVSLIFGLIAHARHGLSAEELISLLIQALNMKDNKDNRAGASETIYLYLRQVRSFLARRDGRYDFFYESFKQAALKKYTSEEEKLPKRKVQSWHKLLADYFYGLTLPNLRKLSELPFQQTYSSMWTELYNTLTDTEFLEQKNTYFSVYDLLDDYRTALGMMPDVNEVAKQRSVIQDFSKTLDRASFVLKENPKLTFPQIYNRLQWQFDKNKLLKNRLVSEKNRFKQPWLRLITKPAESSILIRTFTGHTGPVNACAFKPDGRRILSASQDNTLKLWDVETGEEIFTLRGHSGGMTACAFSLDGKRIVSASENMTLMLWDTHTVMEICTLKGHTNSVNACAFSPDGKRIVSGSRDETLKLWDAQTCEEICTLKGHTGWVRACAFSPDGKRIVSGSRDETLKLWDAQTCQEISTLKGHTDWVQSCSFSPDGKRIVSASGSPFKMKDKTLKLWDKETGEEISTLKGHTSFVYSCAFSPDGKRIVSASCDNTLKLWDVETVMEICTLTGHTHSVNACAFSPDGKRIVSASDDRTLKLWGTQTGKEVTTSRGHTRRVQTCAFSPDGKYVISGSSDNTLRLWDGVTGEEIFILKGHNSSVEACAFSPDGRRIVSASYDNTLKLWDTQTGEEVSSLKGHIKSITACAFSPDGRRIVSASYDNTLKLWDTQTGEEVSSLKGHINPISACAFSPDGNCIVSASEDMTLKLWDTQTGMEISALKGHEHHYVTDCAFSPDGKLIVSASNDSTLKLWDVQTGDEITTLRGHTDPVNACSFSPDGRRIVSASYDNTLKLWDTHTGMEICTLKGHNSSVEACAFSPDGRRIVSGSEDKTLRLWDAQTGEEISALKGQAGEVYTFVFGPDGRRIVLGDNSGQVLLLSIENVELLPIVSSIRIRNFSQKIGKGYWDEKIKATCHWCGKRFPVSNNVIDVINAISRDANLSPDQSPSLNLPDKAWEEPQLLSECPLCHKPLRFNPFIVDNKKQEEVTKTIKKPIQKPEIKSESAGFYFDLGYNHSYAGRIEEAIQGYKEAIRIDPDHVEAHFYLGIAFETLDQVEKAIEEFKIVIRIKEDYTLSHFNLGLAYKKLGSTAEAKHHFKRALDLGHERARTYLDELKPKTKREDANIHFNLGYKYQIDGKIEEAIQEYKEAIRIKPNHAPLHFNLGLAYKKQGIKAEAIYHFKRALELGDESARTNLDDLIPEVKIENAEAHYNLGEQNWQDDKIEEAIKEYKETIRIDPDHISAHFFLGCAYLEQDQSEEAMREYKEVIRIDPDNADAHCAIGTVLESEGQLEEAIEEYKIAVRINEGNALSHFNLGTLYMRFGNTSKAKFHFKRALDLGHEEARPFLKKWWQS